MRRTRHGSTPTLVPSDRRLESIPLRGDDGGQRCREAQVPDDRFVGDVATKLVAETAARLKCLPILVDALLEWLEKSSGVSRITSRCNWMEIWTLPSMTAFRRPLRSGDLSKKSGAWMALNADWRRMNSLILLTCQSASVP